MAEEFFELLAPANNKNVAICAVNSGADAVYIAYKSFGARSQAGNSFEDIVEVVNYAHKFSVKVYITLNTILNDNELKEAVLLIHKLYKIKVDGIIIQDMGLLECDLPPVPVIASTQCHNNNIEKIKFLEKTGFSRVILPRELSLAEIKDISKHTNTELEAFVHGALCVSYSGQCYLSYYTGKRSANRGECAQPCRKKYTLKTKSGKIIAQNKYLLSMKDLNLSNQLGDLIDAGITSFKIEGRLKDENYVKNVVLFYRHTLDKLLKTKGLKKSSDGEIYTEFMPDISKTFNRHYTDFFINCRNKNIPTIDYPNAIGEFIGKIKSIGRNYFELENNILHNADGICFFDDKGNIRGVHINKSEGKKVFPLSLEGLKTGTKIYRTSDKEFEDKLKTAKIKRYIRVNLTISKTDKDLIFKLSDNKNGAVLLIKNEFEPAKNKEIAKKSITSSFEKLKDTEFELNKLNIRFDDIPFIPVSKLNFVRKQLVDKLSIIREKNYPQNFAKEKVIVDYPLSEIDFRGNVLNKKAEVFYERRGAKVVEGAAESGEKLNAKPVMTTKYCLRYQYNMCKKNNPSDVEEELVLTDERGIEFSLLFDCRNCRMEIVSKN